MNLVTFIGSPDTDFSKFADGERLTVTDHNRPVAVLGPVPVSHAIHVVTALHSGSERFVTYDRRHARAAKSAGLQVLSPSV
ncbi:MAG: hypothetical protein HYX29_02970 [Solirubrobacterales bacterium]|nr:hypothetical protein [Solirubrobacterales bacterium]